MTAAREYAWPRWLLSAAVVLLAHGGVAAAILHWHESDDAAPAAAIVIELAPTMMAPEDMKEDVPPGPDQVQADAAPEHKVEKVEEKTEEKAEAKPEKEPQPEIEQAPNPEVAMAEPPKPQEQEQPSEMQLAAPITTAPQLPKVEQGPVAAAPEQAQLSVSDTNAIPNWKRQVVARLERNKRYPAAARQHGDKGTALLAFSLDRQGKVTGSQITKSSGSAALDQEALDLVRRAQPFPPPPTAMPGGQIDLTVPVRFNVH